MLTTMSVSFVDESVRLEYSRVVDRIESKVGGRIMVGGLVRQSLDAAAAAASANPLLCLTPRLSPWNLALTVTGRDGML